MKKVRICTIGQTLEGCRKWLGLDFLNDYGIELVEDKHEPQFAFVNEWMYFRKGSYLEEFLQLDDKVIRIFLAGEAVVPDFNMFDYALCFDEIDFDGRSCRISTLDYFKNNLFTDLHASLDLDGARELLKQKTGFANFLYSNSGCPERNEFFHALSKYKKVDSAGRLLNNMGNVFEDDSDLCWREQSINFKKNYKFSIAFENATHKGYTTEKLLSSMQANTIPIYWGNPAVGELFNSESFVNCHDYKNFDEVIERVIEIDNDDQLYCDILSKPWQTPEQQAKNISDSNKWKGFLADVLAQDPLNARKRASGYYERRYMQRLEGLVEQPKKKSWFRRG